MHAHVPAVPVAGVWYRHVPADAPAMPGHPAPNGRWQRGEQLAGLYLAQDPETVWAEWYRAGRARLTTGHAPAPRPDRAQWPAFQDAGAQLAADGFEGVLSRSSARPAGVCVCVFGVQAGFPGVVPAGSPERIIAAPVPPREMST